MTHERAMELLNAVMNNVSVAESAKETIKRLLDTGFTSDELIDAFDWSLTDVREVECESLMDELYGLADIWENEHEFFPEERDRYTQIVNILRDNDVKIPPEIPVVEIEGNEKHDTTKLLSIEGLQGEEKLCSYCPLPEESRGVRCYGDSPVMCEGSRCKEAYEAYVDETLAEENTMLQWAHGSENGTEVLTYFWVPTDWLCAYLQPEQTLADFLEEYTSDESSGIYTSATLEVQIVYEETSPL